MGENIIITKKQVSQIPWLNWNGVLSIATSYTDDTADIDKNKWVEYVKAVMDAKKLNKIEKKNCNCKNKKIGPAAIPVSHTSPVVDNSLPPSTEDIKL